MKKGATMKKERPYVKCPDCESGYTLARQALNRLVHLLMIAGADSVSRDGVHPWLREAGICVLSPDMVKLSTGLAGRPPRGLAGHDSIDAWVAADKIVAAAGLPKRWGLCKRCKGSGDIGSRT